MYLSICNQIYIVQFLNFILNTTLDVHCVISGHNLQVHKERSIYNSKMSRKNYKRKNIIFMYD